MRLRRLAYHDVFFGVPGGVLHPARDRGNQEKRTHTADKHHAADYNLAHGGKFAGKPHREPAGAVGADDLEAYPQVELKCLSDS